MEEMTFSVLFNIFYEMIGPLFWPGLFIVLFIIFAFIALLFLEKRMVCKRACASLVVGLLGGFVGLFILKNLSVSPSLVVLGGPIDLILAIMTYLGGLLGGAVIIYTFIGWMNALKKGG